jgi:hypothetical protein
MPRYMCKVRYYLERSVGIDDDLRFKIRFNGYCVTWDDSTGVPR